MDFARGVVAVLLAGSVSSLAACSGDVSHDVRGRGLSIASLPATDQAHVYAAATRGAFDVDDPGLSLLLDRRLLPRTTGLAPAGMISNDVVAELRRRGAIKGTCEPKLDSGRGTARCSAALPGYVVRFSPVLALHGDSTQVYVYAQKYDTPSSGISQALRFERAYQVVRRGDDWSAAREGRIPKEVRGESK
jgi:hypothetical protein